MYFRLVNLAKWKLDFFQAYMRAGRELQTDVCVFSALT
jgi:hypothetical protein